MNDTPASSLSIEHITHAYGDRSVLCDVSMIVPSGTLTCLVGASGAGKSTVLRIIAGLNRPQRGCVRLGDEVWGTYGEGRDHHVMPQIRRVGLMFQHPSLFPHLTVLGNVCFGIRHLPNSERFEAAHHWLALVGMRDMTDYYAHQLSGGQQQRVALARALCAQPRVMLLDEPFSSLDPALRRELRDEILSIIRTTHVPMVMVTHDPEEALLVADQMVLLRSEGTVHQAGAPQTLYHHPVDQQVVQFFGSVTRMAGRVQGTVIHTKLGVLPKDRCAPELTEGEDVWVVARPEGIRTAHHGEEGVRVTIRELRPTMQGWMVEAYTPEGELIRWHHREEILLERGSHVVVTYQLPYVHVFPA